MDSTKILNISQQDTLLENSGYIKTFDCKNLVKAKPGGPPLREYKQPMAKHKASPHPSPVKRKLDKNGSENLELSHPWESQPIQHSEKEKYSTMDKTIIE